MKFHDTGSQDAAVSVFGQSRQKRRLGKRDSIANDSYDNNDVAVDQYVVDETAIPLITARLPFFLRVLGGSPPLSYSPEVCW